MFVWASFFPASIGEIPGVREDANDPRQEPFLSHPSEVDVIPPHLLCKLLIVESCMRDWIYPSVIFVCDTSFGVCRVCVCVCVF